MSEHAARPNLNPSYNLIDLVQSDDDNDLRFQHHPHSPSVSPKPRASHNGLPRPFIFKGPRRPDAEVAQDAGGFHHIKRASASASSIQGFRLVTSPGLQNQFRAGSGSTSSSTTTRPDTLTLHKCSATVVNPQHTPKRRRTDAGVIESSRVASRATNPMVLQQGPAGHSHEGNVAEPVLGPAQSHSAAGISRRYSSNSPSRISAEGRIKKPKPHPHAQFQTSKQSELITNALRSQLHPKVRSAVLKHCTSLSSSYQREIGIKVAEALTTNPSFVENLGANGWKLSAEYENKILVWADALVKHYATEVLVLESKPRTEKGRLARLACEATNQGSGKASEVNADSDSSAASSDPKDTSEEEAVLNSRAAFACSRSSSPPTSISAESINVPTNLKRSVDSGSSSDSEGYNSATTPLPRKTKVSRRTTNLPQSQVKLLNIPLTNQPGAQIYVEAGDTSNAAASREVQGLRLVGLDVDTPRPYISYLVREDIRRGFEVACSRGNILSTNVKRKLEGYILHIDFCSEEVECLIALIRPNDARPLGGDPLFEIVSLLRAHYWSIPQIAGNVMVELNRPSGKAVSRLLRNRGKAAIIAFLEDAAAGAVTMQPQLLRLQSVSQHNTKPTQRPRSITSLIREREIWGRSTTRISRSLPSFKATVNSLVEDTYVRQDEWIDCCGDIFTLSWTSDNAFVCGATAHSDSHNMQYNKPGNLLVGSTSLGTLRAVADHRIVRPIVSTGENAVNSLHSMRQTQDPWLYTSVVSTSHSDASGFSFTASFDTTVKVWTVEANGSFMKLCGTWEHEQKVNFVVSSCYHKLVATASDVSNNAIRVYKLDKDDISGSTYDTYTGERAHEQAQELRGRDKWAYFPATIQWGRLERVSHLLLVGYSPRSVTGEDIDIPEDKKNTGELCLWNVIDGTKVPISTARTQNVFEVMWHPSQPIFLAATSPCGTFEVETRTQIHVFAQNEFGAFTQIKSLDCPAFDINEITIMANSSIQSYVTASCTNGNTYVWDTAHSDHPIHVLGHGESLDNPLHDLPREIADTGVKFAAWGKTSDRFYTGSSDGILKAWNIKAPRGKAFLRNILSVSGGISVGAFSKDFSKLLIGDATGKVHLLGVDNSEHLEVADVAKPSDAAPSQPKCLRYEHQSTLHQQGQRPKPIIPHPEPEPPHTFDLPVEAVEKTAQEAAKQFLENNQLILHPDRIIGAVQGHNYHETQFYRSESHVNGDCTQPLLPEWQARQQYEVHVQQQAMTKFPRLPEVKCSDPALHARNLSLDFDISRLSIASQEQLAKDRVDLGFEGNYIFDFELVTPRSKIFRNRMSMSKRAKEMSA